MTLAVHPTVTSTDGTSIGYRSVGTGPGLAIVHGAMESASSHLELAIALSGSHTVHLLDRRGRGMSGPHRSSHDLSTEVDDLAAVLDATGAGDVFGVSSGAIVALEATLRLPQVRRVAIFEPPLIVANSLSTAFVARYRDELAQGDLASALVTAMKGSKMGPAIFSYVPRPLLRALTIVGMRREEQALGPDESSMRALAPTLDYDFGLVEEARNRLDLYANTEAEVLLLGGEGSPVYLQRAMDWLAAALPRARRVVLPGLGHGAAGNERVGGKPAVVAAALEDFFSG